MAVPPVVKEWSGDNTVLCNQGGFRDSYGWILRLWIGPSPQEGFGIRQTHCDRVDTTQLKMVFATGPETHPTLLVHLRGGFPTGKTRCLVNGLEPFPKVSSRDPRRIPDHPAYHQLLEIKLSLCAFQPIKHMRGRINNSRGKPGYFVHQGSPSPQYWNANLKRIAHPSPLSAGCFSAENSVSAVSWLQVGEQTPVVPDKVVSQHYVSVTFATFVPFCKIEWEMFVLVISDQNEWFFCLPVFYESVDRGVLGRLVIRLQ